MKNTGVLFFAVVCFLCGNLFAEEHRDAWASQSFPNNPYQKIKYIGYGNTAYMDTVRFTPLPYCFTPDNRTIAADLKGLGIEGAGRNRIAREMNFTQSSSNRA